MGGAAQVLVVTKDADGVAVNGASSVVRADVQSKNDAVSHVIDAIISIPENVAITAENAGLTELLKAVVYAELDNVLTTTPNLTIFAPINSGFVEFLSSVGAENVTVLNQSVVQDLLEQHVVNSVIYSTSLNPDTPVEVESLEGAKWNVTMAADGSVTVGGANVLIANVQTDNGVVHVIDRVLGNSPAPTPTDEPAGLSTGEAVGIAVGVVAVLGLGYLGVKKCGSKEEGFASEQRNYESV
jgi:transforming growth factor-beta-induced protein